MPCNNPTGRGPVEPQKPVPELTGPVAGADPAGEVPPGLQCLSPREREVAALAARGFSGSRIAKELWVCKDTVKFHLKSVYAKLNVQGKFELVAKWPELSAPASTPSEPCPNNPDHAGLLPD